MFLLDTHILLWMLYAPEKLSENEKEIILNNDNRLSVSVVSLWEMTIKYSLKKLDFKNFSPDTILKLSKDSDVDILNLNEVIVTSQYFLPLMSNHKDPFDRMLIWQCISNKMILISRDKKFEAYKEFGLQLLG